MRALLRRDQPRHRAAGASGRVPASEYERMRAPFMAGAFPFPVKYGYATVGRVEEGPPTDQRAGSCSRFIRIRDDSRCRPPMAVPVPDGVPPARAVLAANMETALNARMGWRARSGRPHRHRRRRRGRAAGRAAMRPHARRGGHASSTLRLDARALARRARRALCAARRGAGATAISSSMPAPQRPGWRPRCGSQARRRPWWS